MSEWQPIETAPKNGTVIDLWCVNDMEPTHIVGGYRFTDCIWLTEFTLVPRWVSRNDDSTVEDSGWRVTHWSQPLPPPPGQTP